MRKTIIIVFLFVISGFLNAQSIVKTMSNLPDTGQTTSYTATFGEDHDYSFNTQSFTNNDAYTVTDNVTGLMWQRTDGGEMTYENAITYCDNLVLGGYSDWRLPTKQESMSILNLDKNNPALNTTYFPNTTAEYWWTSTIHYSDAAKIWVTNAGGGTGPKGKIETISAGGTYKFHARAVRNVTTPTTINHFTDNGDGTITDNLTNLMWIKSPVTTTYTWEQALTYSENLSFATYSDWRLPNIKELVSINDDTRNAPSINVTYFPTVVSSRYWSSTTQFNPAGTSGWFNDFQNAGISSYDLKTISHNVICVRGTGTLGLNQSSLNKTGFIVYPNPTQDKLNIVCDSTLNKIQITDVQGRIIKIIAPKSETNSIVVEVSKLEHGTYFVTITGDSGISTQQFIKL